MKTIPWIIAGGGIAGLANALAVALHGVPVHLLERAEAFSEVGAGLQIGPNAVAALKAIGAWEFVEPLCVSPPEINIRDGLTGQLLQTITLGEQFARRFGQPYRVIHRADLLHGLLLACRGQPLIEMETGASVQSAGSLPDKVTTTLDDGRALNAPALIIADGIRSTLRGACFPTARVESPPYVIYRALCAMQHLPGEINPDAVNLWLSPAGHIVHYPVGKPWKLNLVAVTQGTLPDSGWSTPAATEEVTNYFAKACPALHQILRQPESWLKWPAANVTGLLRWNSGRMMLTGDAAHGTVPFLAQGAAMALEDAAALTAALGAHMEPADAFAMVSLTRLPRVRRLQAQSLKSGRIYHMGGLERTARNTAMRLLPEQAFLQQLAWIYNHP
jgi:salicylate hydroxylase